MKALQALQHLASVRPNLFETTDKRIGYVALYLTEIVKFLQSASLQTVVMADRQLYKEFVPILLRL